MIQENQQPIRQINDEKEEELEYESDGDVFENIYLESQLGVSGKLENNIVDEKIIEENDNEFDNDKEFDGDDDIENTFGNNSEQEEHYEKQFEEEFEKSFEEEYIEDEGNTNVENDDVTNIDTSIDENTVNNAENEKKYIDTNNNTEPLELLDNFSESENEVEQIDQTGPKEKPIANISLTEKIEYKSDPFDDDELIEYVDDPEGAGNKDSHYSTVDNEFETLSQIPIYLDFSELINREEMTLDNVFLKDEIKVNFDFMKLFPPNCKEDKLYFEFTTLFKTLDECIDLKFDKIFKRIGAIMDINLNSFNIHLTFNDLLNFTIQSDSSFSNELNLRQILESYEKLKNQSSNPDLYGFLSIKVGITRTPKRQFNILCSSLINGFKLENIGEVIKNKEICLKIEENEANDEPPKKVRRTN